MTKHSPGPWRQRSVAVTGYDKHGMPEEAEWFEILDANDDLVVALSTDILFADIDLIEAAPRLLKACQLVLQELDLDGPLAAELCTAVDCALGVKDVD